MVKSISKAGVKIIVPVMNMKVTGTNYGVNGVTHIHRMITMTIGEIDMNCSKCGGNGVFRIVQARYTNDLTCSACMGTGTDAPLVKYAGIGSRETPQDIANRMTSYAVTLGLRQFVLRSGAGKAPQKPTPGTMSADLAFEAGCDMVGTRKVIRCATHWQPALDHAAQFHPNWGACNEYAQGLHARNSLILLGDWLDDPVSFVLCWTKGGAITGGTGQGIRIAMALGIPVFNFAIPGHIESFEGWLNQ